jgi:hypothetical protein
MQRRWLAGAAARLATAKMFSIDAEKPLEELGRDMLILLKHPNAGIGGTTIGFFKTYAPLIANESNPELVVSVGIRDAPLW